MLLVVLFFALFLPNMTTQAQEVNATTETSAMISTSEIYSTESISENTENKESIPPKEVEISKQATDDKTNTQENAPPVSSSSVEQSNSTLDETAVVSDNQTKQATAETKNETVPPVIPQDLSVQPTDVPQVDATDLAKQTEATLRRTLQTEGIAKLSKDEVTTLAGYSTFFAAVNNKTGELLAKGNPSKIYASMGNLPEHGGNVYTMTIGNEVVFCIEPFTTWAGGAVYTGEIAPEEIVIPSRNLMYPGDRGEIRLTRELQTKLEQVVKFGYYANPTDMNYKFSQSYVWEIVGATVNINKGYLAENHDAYTAWRADVDTKIANYVGFPSWSGDTINRRVGESFTLTDTNGVFARLLFDSVQNGLQLERLNDTDLKVTVLDNAQSGKILFTENTTVAKPVSIIYKHPKWQTFASLNFIDPVGGSFNFTLLPSLGNIELVKKATDGQFVPNVEFELLDANQVVIATKTTDSTGYLQFTNLQPANYFVREKSVPTGFVLNTEVKAVTVAAGEWKMLSVINERQSGYIGLQKVSRQHGKTLVNKNYSLANAIYSVMRASDQVEVGRITTDETGFGSIYNIDPIDYLIKEIQAPKGFMLSDEVFRVSLTPTNNTTKLFEHYITAADDEITGSITLQKVSRQHGKTLVNKNYSLANAVYSVVRASDKVEVGRITTDAKGVGTITNLALDHYIVKEVKAPKGFTLSSEEFQVSLIAPEYANANVTKQVTATDDEIKGSITLQKVSRQHGKTLVNKNYSLANAVYSVVRASDKVEVGRITTDAKGVGAITNLALGHYIVKEVKAPKGFTLSNEEFQIALTQVANSTANVTKQVTAADDEIKGLIKVIKKDHEIDKFLAGAKFNVLTTDNKVVDTFTTDAKGVGISKSLPIDQYTLVEVEAPTQYQLDATPISVDFTTKVGKVAVIEITKTVLNKELPPQIGTTLTDTKGNKEVNPLVEVVLKDTVQVRNAIVGKVYNVFGTLKFPENGETVLYKGKEVTATTQVVAKTTDFTVDLFFTFDASALRGRDVVALEDLYTNGRKVASEAKLDNPPQTVHIRNPHIGTFASFVTGEKTRYRGGSVTINDLVKYYDVMPNEAYRLKGVLMNKQTNEVVVINGKEVRHQVEFIATESNGEMIVPLLLEDTSDLVGEFVVFEELEYLKVENPKTEDLSKVKGEKIAEHQDINDKDQTVVFEIKPQPQLPYTGEANSVVVILLALVSIVLSATLVIVGRKEIK